MKLECFQKSLVQIKIIVNTELAQLLTMELELVEYGVRTSSLLTTELGQVLYGARKS